MIPGAINNECVGFSIIEIEKLCKENTECKAEQAYVRNQKPVPLILAGGWAGGLAGLKIGAAIGGGIGAIPGSVIGGTIGGIAGSLGFSWIGTGIIDTIYGK